MAGPYFQFENRKQYHERIKDWFRARNSYTYSTLREECDQNKTGILAANSCEEIFMLLNRECDHRVIPLIFYVHINAWVRGCVVGRWRLHMHYRGLQTYSSYNNSELQSGPRCTSLRKNMRSLYALARTEARPRSPSTASLSGTRCASMLSAPPISNHGISSATFITRVR